MDDAFRRAVMEPLRDFLERVLSFLPNLISAVVVLAAGVAISVAVRFALQKLLAAVGLDRHAEKSGVMDLLKMGGIKWSFSGLISRLVFWLLVVMFAIISLGTLNVPQVDRLQSEFFLYLPNIFAAVVLVFVGYMLANFLAKAVLVSAVNAGLQAPGLLSKAVKTLVISLSVTMALEQLGIGRGTILVAFSIMLGGAVFALAIAFGLGAKDIARNFLEKSLKEKKEEDKKDEISHL